MSKDDMNLDQLSGNTYQTIQQFMDLRVMAQYGGSGDMQKVMKN